LSALTHARIAAEFSEVFDLILRIYLRLAAATVLLGWVLSATKSLRPLPYLTCFFVITVIVVTLTLRHHLPRRLPLFHRRLLLWLRQRRMLPLIFALVFGLSCLGAIVHEPNNFDGLSYRVPRVLYWMSGNGWHWIDTPYFFLNCALPNFEWASLPALMLTGDIHAAVVLNLVAYLFVPGLFFRLLRVFGVAPRLAYDWMWLFPAGYLLAMQAGGLGNDLIGVMMILASLHFAARFAQAGGNGNLVDALLAAGFCTGIKLSNLPLAIFPMILLLKRPAQLASHKAALATGTILGAGVSALIPMALNLAYSGSVLGTTSGMVQVSKPVAGIFGNSLIMTVAACSPPILPQANSVTTMLERSLGENTTSWLKTNYANFTLKLNELPQEEGGGLGLGITFALIVCGWLWWRTRNEPTRQPDHHLARWQWVSWCGWLTFAYLVIAAKLGTGGSFPRNLLPWFPIALAPVLGLIGSEAISRRRLWRITATVAALSVLPTMFLTPSRPLIPVERMIALARSCGVKESIVDRARVVYQVYSERADTFRDIRRSLPENVTVLGLLTDGSEATASWWKPYGSRKCTYLLTPESVARARRAGVEYVAIRDSNCRDYFNQSVEQWLATYRGEVIATFDVRIVAAATPERYTLVRLKP